MKNDLYFGGVAMTCILHLIRVNGDGKVVGKLALWQLFNMQLEVQASEGLTLFNGYVEP